MNSLNEDYSSHDYNFNSASDPVSIERREGRSNSSSSRVFSTTHLLTNRRSISTNHHNHDATHGKSGKRIRELKDQLENIINDSLSLPIELLESTLFDLAHEYYKERNWAKPVLCTFATMHPIQKLISVDNLNSDKWANLSMTSASTGVCAHSTITVKDSERNLSTPCL